MSGAWLARPVGRNLDRAGLGARVAGAHLAATRCDGTHAGTRLVPGIVPRKTMEFFLAPSSQCGADRFDASGGGIMGLQVHRSARNEALLEE